MSKKEKTKSDRQELDDDEEDVPQEKADSIDNAPRKKYKRSLEPMISSGKGTPGLILIVPHILHEEGKVGGRFVPIEVVLPEWSMDALLTAYRQVEDEKRKLIEG